MSPLKLQENEGENSLSPEPDNSPSRAYQESPEKPFAENQNFEQGRASKFEVSETIKEDEPDMHETQRSKFKIKPFTSRRYPSSTYLYSIELPIRKS